MFAYGHAAGDRSQSALKQNTRVKYRPVSTAAIIHWISHIQNCGVWFILILFATVCIERLSGVHTFQVTGLAPVFIFNMEDNRIIDLLRLQLTLVLSQGGLVGSSKHSALKFFFQ